MVVAVVVNTSGGSGGRAEWNEVLFDFSFILTLVLTSVALGAFYALMDDCWNLLYFDGLSPAQSYFGFKTVGSFVWVTGCFVLIPQLIFSLLFFYSTRRSKLNFVLRLIPSLIGPFALVSFLNHPYKLIQKYAIGNSMMNYWIERAVQAIYGLSCALMVITIISIFIILFTALENLENKGIKHNRYEIPSLILNVLEFSGFIAVCFMIFYVDFYMSGKSVIGRYSLMMMRDNDRFFVFLILIPQFILAFLNYFSNKGEKRKPVYSLPLISVPVIVTATFAFIIQYYHSKYNVRGGLILLFSNNYQVFINMMLAFVFITGISLTVSLLSFVKREKTVN